MLTQTHNTVRRAFRAGDQAQKGGFAGAIGTNEGNTITSFNEKIGSEKDNIISICMSEILRRRDQIEMDWESGI